MKCNFPTLDARRGWTEGSQLPQREQEPPLRLRKRDLQPGDLLLEWAQAEFNKEKMKCTVEWRARLAPSTQSPCFKENSPLLQGEEETEGRRKYLKVNSLPTTTLITVIEWIFKCTKQNFCYAQVQRRIFFFFLKIKQHYFKFKMWASSNPLY